MSALVKLDRTMVRNTMGWRSEYPGMPAVAELVEAYPPWSPGEAYAGVLAYGEIPEAVRGGMVVNKRVTIPLDCSVDPRKYHVLISPNPRLFEVAEVSCATLVPPGFGRIRPVLHIRALSSFEFADFEWLVSLHCVD